MPLRLAGTPDPQAPPEWRQRRPGQEALEWLQQVFGGPESIAGLATPVGLVGYRALAQQSPDLIEALRRLVSLKRLSRTIDPAEGLGLARARAEWASRVPEYMERAGTGEITMPAAPTFLSHAEAGFPPIPEALQGQRFPKLELAPGPRRLEDVLEEMARVRVGGGGAATGIPQSPGGQRRLKAAILKTWLKGARGAEREEIRAMADLPLEQWQRIFPLSPLGD